MSKIVRRLKEILSDLFIPKVIESEPKSHRPKKKHLKHTKHVRTKVKKHVKIHVKKIHHHLKKHSKIHHKIQKIKHKVKRQPKIEKEDKQLINPPKTKQHVVSEKVVYGIPKHHTHEAELKVAEKSTDIDGEYSKEITDKKVQLKIQEKSAGEIDEKIKPKHTFFFRLSKKTEKQEEPKKKEEKKEKEIHLDPKKKHELKQIIEAIRKAHGKNVILTNLDLLLEIVNYQGKVSVDYVADAFGMEEKKVAELANILQNNNLIEIHYPPFGKMEFKKVSVGAK